MVGQVDTVEVGARRGRDVIADVAVEDVSVRTAAGNMRRMNRMLAAAVVAVITTVSLGACASDEAPGDDAPAATVPGDGTVPSGQVDDPGVKTQTDKPGNLGFDETDEAN